MLRAFRILLLLAAALVMVSSTQPAVAQGGRAEDMPGIGNEPGPGNAPSEEKRDEVRKKVEAVRIWRLTEALKLDSQTSAKLSSLLGPLDQQRQDLMREHMLAMRVLRQALKAKKPDQEKIKTALETIEKNRHALDGLRDKEISGVKDILTIEQRARFVLFQQDFRREMLGMISGARGGGPGRGKTGGPGAPGDQTPRGPRQAPE